ncbi:MAG TPA: transposase, partial [Nostocaceae cyanobacterium]|nr:transposase [Nostocaceae cyanobacterium]
VVNELQLRYQPEMPRRMRAYAALAEEKFNLPTYPVLINLIKSTNAEIPTNYSSNVGGLRAIQDYRVINLWEVDVNIVFTQPLPSLLPFVPILKGGDNESTIREALRILRTDENLNQLETVLGFFATFVLDSALVQQIMRWDMVILEQSPWYQEIFKKGELQGEVRGRVQGKEEGRKEELISSLELILEMKFGSEGLELMNLISSITDLGKLKEIQLAIKNSQTVNELQQFLLSEN